MLIVPSKLVNNVPEQQAQLAQTNPSSLLCMQKNHEFHQHLLFRFVDKVFYVALLRLECLVHVVSV